MLSKRETSAGTQLYVWGCDSHGQLGLPQNTGVRAHNLPKQISVLHSIRTISCGEKHMAMITLEGDVLTQGCNADGKLGIDDKAVKWSNVPVRVPLPLPAVRIDCGMSHTLCLLENGDVYSWGFGEYGALGVGEFKTKWKPTKVYLDGVRIKHIFAGAMHSSFISTSGQLYMCGSNDYGELGNGRKQKLSVPTLVHMKVRLVEASCGIFYTLMLDEQGRVYSMGNNKYGQLGTGTKNPESTPTLVKSLENQYIVKVESGYHSGALNDKGDLFLWGSGTFGEYLRPTRIKKPYPFIDLSIGGFFGAAIDSKHNVYTWGNNNSGELGLGHFQNCKELTEVSFLRGKNINRVFCGVNFVVAMATGNQPLPQSIRGQTQPYMYHTERERDDRLQRQSIGSRSPQGRQARIHSSIERAGVVEQRGVRQLRNTVLELEENERHLLQDRKELELKLENLAADYEKLCKKYDMIEIIVNEKEKIIGIYEGKIRELSSKSHVQEEMTAEIKILKQDSRKLNETIERNAQLYAQKLRLKDDIIIRLERAEKELLEEIGLLRNELKLSENLLKDRLEEERNQAIRQARSVEKEGLLAKYESLLKQKDSDIASLQAKNDELSRQLSKWAVENARKHDNIRHTSDKIETLLKIKEEEEIEYIRKINKLENALREKEEQLLRSERQALDTYRQIDTGRVDLSATSRGEELRLKDEMISQLRREIARQQADTSRDSPSLVEALKLQNQQLMDQLELKNHLVERLNAELQVRQETYEKYATTFRNSTEQLGTNFNRELERQIELSTKLKLEVEQLNFQLKHTQKELEQVAALSLEKEKAYQHELQVMATQKQKKEMVIEEKEVESAEQQHLIKGIRNELERSRCELVQERDNLRKNDDAIRKLTDDTLQLRKALAAAELSLRIKEEELEVVKAEVERVRRFKKEFETKELECLQLKQRVSDSESKLELLNSQLTIRNKAMKEVERQLKDEVEASQRKEADANNEIRKLKEARNKLAADCKEQEEAKETAVKRMETISIEWEKEKQFSASLEKRSDQLHRELQQERSDRQNVQNEMTEVKREVMRTRLQKEELSRNFEALQSDYRLTQEKCRQWEEKMSAAEKQMKEISIQLGINKEENVKLRETLANREEELQDQRNVSAELVSANKQFAGNEVEYVKRIEELERQIIDIRNQNEDYNPRYEALIQRNKELDERNAELADMLNKAIERQASNYKEKVLSDVAKNAGSIYEQLKESAVVSTNKKRRVIQQPESAQMVNDQLENKSGLGVSGSAIGKSPQREPQPKPDPYKKIMSAKITDHKRRISESAMKLVELLDVEKDSKNPIDTLSDYQRINDRIESIEMQKSNLLSKINNYAERLKIL